MPAQFVVEAGDELRNLLLGDRGGEVNIPGGEAGKCLGIARKQTMEECGTASQVADDKQRFLDLLGFMSREKDVIQKETEPMDELSDRPDCVEHQKEDYSFA